ncbi:response regulator [Sulfurimonas sp.]
MYKNIEITKLISFTKELKVLYVEDNKESQEALEALLGNYFSDITVVFDGIAAFEKFKSEKFDLIITDIRMPKMDGIELIRNIRTLNEDIPIIVSTAHKESDYLIKCIEMGVGGYLLKPINHKQLLKVI